MVGMALRKLAKENGMQMDHGVAYGDFHGYAVTLSEGAGYKLLQLTAKFQEADRVDQLLELVNRRDLQKEFRIQKFEVGEDYCAILFFDNPGTMKKLEQFVDWFFPLLPQYGVLGTDYCSCCGQALGTGGSWKLVNGTALHVHESCAASLMRQIQAEAAQEELEDTGTYAGGFLGALLGAVVGAIPWAIALYFGYLAALLGLLIGWLSTKGYEKFHGKKGPGKLPIVILTSIVGVILGCIAGDVITLWILIGEGEFPYFTYGDIPAMMLLLFQDAEYVAVTLKNLGLGLLFALLGNLGTLRGLRAEQKSRTPDVKNLK